MILGKTAIMEQAEIFNIICVLKTMDIKTPKGVFIFCLSKTMPFKGAINAYKKNACFAEAIILAFKTMLNVYESYRVFQHTNL